MNAVTRYALAIALGSFAAAYLGPVKVGFLGVFVAIAAYAYERWVAPLF